MNKTVVAENNMIATTGDKEVPVIKDKVTIDFLLKEYERLVEYQKATIEDYNRWFNVYVGIMSASIVILASLSQVLKTGNEPVIINIIFLGLFFIGIINFIGLCSANSTIIQNERAIRLIQTCFIERDRNTHYFLYFQKNEIGAKGSGPRALLTRGLTGGSPKALLVFLNSIIASILVVKIGIEMGHWQPAFFLVFIGLGISILVAAIHLLIALMVNTVHGVYKTN